MGAGSVQPPDPWTNADVDPRWNTRGNSVHIQPAGRLPWDDDWYDGTCANHVLQMIAWPDLVPWLAEVRRVTAGPVRLLVPDMPGAVDAWQRGDADWFPISDEHESSVDGKFAMYVMQAGATRTFFTPAWLMELCARAGFESVSVGGYGVCDQLPLLASLDSRPNESIVVTAW